MRIIKKDHTNLLVLLMLCAALILAGLSLALSKYAFIPLKSSSLWLYFLPSSWGNGSSFSGTGGYSSWPSCFSTSSVGESSMLSSPLECPVHMDSLVAIEKKLFGHLPTLYLQQLLYQKGSWRWHDTVLLFVHASHFVMFILVALLLWARNLDVFATFKWAIALSAYMGLLTYYLYPAASPWMARQYGLIEPMDRMFFLRYNFYFPRHLILFLDTNPAAAMPSLHITFPVICQLSLFQTFRWRSSVFVAYLILILVVLVYGGEHYVIDIIAGLLYGLFAFGVSYFRTGFCRKNKNKWLF